MMLGKLPFSKEQVREGNVSEPNLSRKAKGGMSSQAIDLLGKLLESDEKNRLTIDEALKHGWFSDNSDGDAIAGEENCCEEVIRSRAESGGGLSRMSLTPGSFLGKILSQMREREDSCSSKALSQEGASDEDPKLEGGEGIKDGQLTKISPHSVLTSLDDSCSEDQLIILRTYIESQFQASPRARQSNHNAEF